jgi:hypothetical protein
MGRLLNLKVFIPNGTMTAFFIVREKYKIIWSGWSVVPEKEKEAL